MVLATFLLVDMFLKHINNHLEPKKMSSVKELKSYRLKFGKKKKNPADQKKKTHQIRKRKPTQRNPHGRSEEEEATTPTGQVRDEEHHC